VFDTIAAARHGGDLREVAQRYGIAVSDLLDFSANVNPNGPPREVLEAIEWCIREPERLTRYPESQPHALREALAHRHGIGAACIVVGNGAAALIDAAVRTLETRACVVPVPVFSEYPRALAAARVELVRYRLDSNFDFDDAGLLALLERAGARMLVLVNPHNPSGAAIERTRIERLIDACSRRGVFVLLDEAFIDYAPEGSAMQTAIASEHCIVIRSLTKLYGMAGIRIGYATASPALARSVAMRLPSWPTGALEIAAANAALNASGFAPQAITRNCESREHLARALKRLGIRVFPSAANFLLVELPCSPVELPSHRRAGLPGLRRSGNARDRSRRGSHTRA
jgi:threonine-phosphate decarboxylase